MKIGRNDPCPCGSGQKYKKCCSAKDEAAHAEVVAAEAAERAARAASAPASEEVEAPDAAKPPGLRPAKGAQWKPKDLKGPRAFAMRKHGI